MKLSLTASLYLSASIALAQFITPTYRNGADDNDFADWVGFDVAYTPQSPPYETLSSSQINVPFGGGNQNARIGQFGTPGAIITSSQGIYTFGQTPTAFRVYDNPAQSPGSILFQTETITGSGALPDPSTIRFFYRTTGEGDFIEADLALAGNLISSSSTGNRFTAWEWDTSSLTIEDYYIQFAYAAPHASFIAAQLDTNETFEQQLLAFGIEITTNIPFGFEFGLIKRTPEKPLYADGEQVTIEALVNSSFGFIKWITPEGDVFDNPLTVTITEDMQLTLVLGATSYEVWRFIAFPSWHTGAFDMSTIWPQEIDYDGDSQVNALEYAIGGQPENGTLALSSIKQEIVSGEDGKHYPAVTFRQQVVATDLSYEVHVSRDMKNWFVNGDPGGPFTEAPEVLSVLDDGTQIVRVRAAQPLDAGNPNPFMQLSVSLN